jgi:hypothetical protein
LVSFAINGLRGDLEEGPYTKTETDVSGHAARRASLIKDRIVNAINYLHFQGRSVYAVFRHRLYRTTVTVEAFPLPCQKDYLYLAWKEQGKLKERSSSYEMQHVLISAGRRIFSLRPDLVDIDDTSIRFDVSKAVGTDVTVRKVERYPCQEIHVEVIQNSISFRGKLYDFSAFSFSATLSLQNFLSFKYINPDIAVTVFIKKGEELLYSGECRILRYAEGIKGGTFVLEPVTHHLYRFKPKTHRSPRHRLHPSPNVVFPHPFTGKTLSLTIDEISGSGFSVIERRESSTLLAGMILPHADVEFAYGVKVNCRAQVMTQSIVPDTSSLATSKKVVRCGIAILDMDPANQTLLASILHQATNQNAFVCNRVDIDKLWEFFFESGFIYPKKYFSIQQTIDKFKATYKKLYLESPDIARHFIYQDKGQIQGHISMIRFFENTWLFHHHAAVGPGRAGLVVLDQIGRYVNDFYNMHSSHLQYVICYFRPGNRFPDRVFGGYARHLANSKLCSLDDFAHILFRKSGHLPTLPASMTLEPSTAPDLSELEDYYSHLSGGLMLNAFELDPTYPSHSSIKGIYEKRGMMRDRLLYSLKEGENLKALFMVNISDAGLNMSNLTNCVTAFVLDENGLILDHFYSACNIVVRNYAEDKAQFLVYPLSYAEKVLMRYETVYRLWAFNTQHTDHYLDFVSSLLGKG